MNGLTEWQEERLCRERVDHRLSTVTWGRDAARGQAVDKSSCDCGDIWNWKCQLSVA